MNSYLVGVLAAALSANIVFAQAFWDQSGHLADAKGRTLYTFDRDSIGKSNCTGACAAVWPPYLAGDGVTPDSARTIIVRDDGTKQWAQNGKPLYYYVADTRAGAATGDGRDGVWHVVKQPRQASGPGSYPTPAASIGVGYAY